MKKTTLFGLGGIAAIALASASVLALSGEGAHAQSGSRLCGWVKKTDDGAIGYLYEARQADLYYDDKCASATLDLLDEFDHDKYLELKVLYAAGEAITKVSYSCKDMPMEDKDYHRRCEYTCEDVGEGFQSSNSPKDMCDKMAAHESYKVVFDKASNSTTYKKL